MPFATTSSESDMNITLSGPSHPPHSGGKPKRLVILLHGLGADGNDLIGLAPYWAPALPDAEFVSPNAPFPCDMARHGYPARGRLGRSSTLSSPMNWRNASLAKATARWSGSRRAR